MEARGTQDKLEGPETRKRFGCLEVVNDGTGQVGTHANTKLTLNYTNIKLKPKLFTATLGRCVSTHNLKRTFGSSAAAANIECVLYRMCSM